MERERERERERESTNTIYQKKKKKILSKKFYETLRKTYKAIHSYN